MVCALDVSPFPGLCRLHDIAPQVRPTSVQSGRNAAGVVRGRWDLGPLLLPDVVDFEPSSARVPGSSAGGTNFCPALGCRRLCLEVDHARERLSYPKVAEKVVAMWPRQLTPANPASSEVAPTFPKSRPALVEGLLREPRPTFDQSWPVLAKVAPKFA